MRLKVPRSGAQIEYEDSHHNNTSSNKNAAATTLKRASVLVSDIQSELKFYKKEGSLDVKFEMGSVTVEGEARNIGQQRFVERLEKKSTSMITVTCGVNPPVQRIAGTHIDVDCNVQVEPLQIIVDLLLISMS